MNDFHLTVAASSGVASAMGPSPRSSRDAVCRQARAACRAQASRAQELACVRKRLHVTRLLLVESSAAFTSAKCPQMASAFVQDVLSTVQRYMCSAKHCFFVGVPLGRRDATCSK